MFINTITTIAMNPIMLNLLMQVVILMAMASKKYLPVLPKPMALVMRRLNLGKWLLSFLLCQPTYTMFNFCVLRFSGGIFLINLLNRELYEVNVNINKLTSQDYATFKKEYLALCNYLNLTPNIKPVRDFILVWRSKQQ